VLSGEGAESVVESLGPRPARRVSWRPGAEGAEAEVMCENWVELEDGGAILMAWLNGLASAS
jgi:hypothetical protein